MSAGTLSGAAYPVRKRHEAHRENAVNRITVNDLLKAGVHFGHQTKSWNPKMKPYVYGVRHGVTIFDLTITIKQLAAACDFLREVTANGGDILFVGTKRQAQQMVQEGAQRCGMYFMADRWLGGTLTNHRIIRTRIQRLKDLRAMEADGRVDEMPNKEAAEMRRELSKLERTLAGIADLQGLPDAMVVIDIENDDIAVKEGKRLNIPIVAVVDSNCDPDMVDYVVPGNDDAVRSLRLLLDAFVSAVEEGNAEAGRVVELPPELAAKQEAENAAEEETPASGATEPAEDAETAAPEAQEQSEAQEEPSESPEPAPGEKAEEQASETSGKQPSAS